jgi:hypothetical protein
VSANAPGLLIIERILRDRQGIWQQVVEDRGLSKLTGQMLVSSAAALAVYGAVLGSFHSVLMALTSAVKLPLLFLVTLAICLPTLYLFNLVFGARLSVRQSLSLVMVAITVTAMLALAFAPISLFFLITAPDYGFFKLLNVAILGLSALVGLRFLTGGMRVLSDHGLLAPATATPAVAAPATAPPVPATVPAELVHAGAPGPDATATNGTAVATQPAPAGTSATQPLILPPGGYSAARRPHGQLPALPPRQPSMTLLHVWILLFGFVGTQLAWTLRPFFGSPGQPFGLYRKIDGNFYGEILRTIANLF